MNLGDKRTMGKNISIKYSSLLSLYLTAKGFQTNYEYLKKKLVETLGKLSYESPMPVAATNGFFAIELYLKLIYSFDYWEKHQRIKKNPVNSTQFYKGHNLIELFECIDEDSKIEIIKLLPSNISKEQILVNLEKYKDGFIEWRYFFAKGSIDGDFYFISNVLEALHSYCERYMNYSHYTNDKWAEDYPHTSATMHQEPVNSMQDLNNALSKNLSEVMYKK